MSDIPDTQYAVQLVGPGQLVLNRTKRVIEPGPHQILAKTEAVGLCFSDMKLLKQFDQHVRKSEVLSGISQDVLEEIPAYVPGSMPTVPGHEVVCRILKVGSQVRHYKVGERWLIQADYRTLKTAGSNGAFGYNFEGGLQEYILLDERVIGDPADENGYMIAVDDERGASQSALVEPWACVENSYVTPERQGILVGGRCLLVADNGRSVASLPSILADGLPSELSAFVPRVIQRAIEEEFAGHGPKLSFPPNLDDLPDEGFDDIVYFGSNASTLELLSDKLGKGAILNVVLGGHTIGQEVTVGVGRIHYGGTRWVGTTGDDASEGYRMIPPCGEVRSGDRVLVVGAGGPMGQMHVLRDVGFEGVEVVASDVDAARLQALSNKVPEGAHYRPVLSNDVGDERFDYIALMAPVPALLVDAIGRAAEGALVNVFAGIPAPVKHPIDLDRLIDKRVFVFGTSGSEPRDMRLVLQKVVEGRLDTNASVAAVSGMAGATEGLAAVENRSVEGKIIVYPQLHDVGLWPLARIGEAFPTVAEKLRNGKWTLDAEKEFLEVAE